MVPVDHVLIKAGSLDDPSVVKSLTVRARQTKCSLGTDQRFPGGISGEPNEFVDDCSRRADRQRLIAGAIVQTKVHRTPSSSSSVIRALRRMEESVKKSLKRYVSLFIRGWFGSILIALLIATSFKSAIADWYVVPTGSMKPTILEGDRIFANKLAYDLKVPFTNFHIANWDDPKRGDIVVFNSPADEKCLVKRVVAIPGDTIAMRNNQLSVNGEALRYDPVGPRSLEESFLFNDSVHELYTEDLTGHKHKTMVTPYRPSIRSFAPVTVPNGQYFMMGDNRDNSADSRYFGLVDRKRILGQATVVVISLDLQHYYQPRWPRFFTKLQ
jgi:signal peptidase I